MSSKKKKVLIVRCSLNAQELKDWIWKLPIKLFPQDFAADPMHVCVKGEIQASRCRFLSRYLELQLLSRNLGSCAWVRNSDLWTGGCLCSLESIRCGPENDLPSLKVGNGCHWNFWVCLKTKEILTADRLAEVIYGRLMGVPCSVGLPPVGNTMLSVVCQFSLP